jgi:hypothetical protein
VRVVRCPSCRHRNRLIMLMYAHHVVVKSAAAIPKRNLMGAALDLLSRVRPRLP